MINPVSDIRFYSAIYQTQLTVWETIDQSRGMKYKTGQVFETLDSKEIQTSSLVKGILDCLGIGRFSSGWICELTIIAWNTKNHFLF